MPLQLRGGGHLPSLRQLRPIDDEGQQQPGPPRLPTCKSDQQPFALQSFSNTMMKAYVDMRGPDLMSKRPRHEGDNGDGGPLFTWFRRQVDITPELEQELREEHGKDVKLILQDIDNAHMSPSSSIVSTPTPSEKDQQPPYPQLRRTKKARQAVFEITRPQTAPHIRPPTDMSLSLHHLAASCADFDFNDVDDDEDDECGLPAGRISPCTFAAWAEGCSRWDGKVVRETASLMSDARCDGVATIGGVKETHTPQKQHQDDENKLYRHHCHETSVPFVTPSRICSAKPDWYFNMVNQYDEETHEQISPYYKVPSNPSMLHQPCDASLNGSQEVLHENYSVFNEVDGSSGEGVGETTYLEETQSDDSLELPIQHPPTSTNPITEYCDTAQILANQWAQIATLRREEAVLNKFKSSQQSRKLQLTHDLAQLRQHIGSLQKIRRRQEQQQEQMHNQNGSLLDRNISQHPHLSPRPQVSQFQDHDTCNSRICDIHIQQERHYARDLHAFILDAWSRVEGQRRENHEDEMAIIALEAEMEALLAEIQ